MGRMFGTDGVRGVANQELTPELAFKLGRAGSFVLSKYSEGRRPRLIVGKDTRISGDMLESALVAGICSTGADAMSVGVLPTPGIAYLTCHYEASAGVVISASHNPVADNGIKFFGSTGEKLADAIEDEIENLIESPDSITARPSGTDIGRLYNVENALNNYMDRLAAAYSLKEGLKGMSMVIDCANGSAYQAAPLLWRDLGARVQSIHDQPNGININVRCGSTHTESLRRAVLENQAQLGVAYDGDADRCIMVDELGNELDGDQLLLICALDMQRERLLNPPAIVATVMSNIGLEIALRRENVRVESCKVGDRYVWERMQQSGALLGGEQSGHIIFGQHSTTGDGILTSLKVVEVMKKTGLPLSVLAGEMERYPQLLINVHLQDKEKILQHDIVQEAIRRAESRLGESGKLVVRPSGTEPMVRLMAQGPEKEVLEEVLQGIRDAIGQVQ